VSSKPTKDSTRARARNPAIHLPGGTFLMGSDRHYPEEAPTHHVRVAAFAMEPFPVTNAEFAAFVRSTGYVTVADRSTPRTTPEPFPRTSCRDRWCSRRRAVP